MNTRIHFAAASAVIAALIAMPASGAEPGRSASVVPNKVEMLAVNASSLVRLAVDKDAITRIDFPKNEHIQSVALSNPKAWNINISEGVLFVSPTTKNGVGNMHVIARTSSGRQFKYQFELRAKSPRAKSPQHVIELRHAKHEPRVNDA